MEPNNNRFNTQNLSNFPFNYNYNVENQSSSQRPQNLQSGVYPPNFMPSVVPNFNPYHYGMPIPPPQMYHQNSQFYNPYTSMGNENVSHSGATEFPEFSTQVTLDDDTPTPEDLAIPTGEGSSAPRKKNHKWTTSENLVLLSGWMKFGTDSIIGRGQKGDSYWGKVAQYCNEHCSFEPPRDFAVCRNHFNYMNKLLGKWVGAYEKARRSKKSGWSEDDVMTAAHEQYKKDNKSNFTLIQEWRAIRDQPRYASQVGGNTTSDSSGSKRTRDSDTDDSISTPIEAIPRPLGREATKKKGRRIPQKDNLERVDEDYSSFQEFKKEELKRLDTIAIVQDEANRCTKMTLWVKLSEKEDRSARDEKLFAKLTSELGLD